MQPAARLGWGLALAAGLSLSWACAAEIVVTSLRPSELYLGAKRKLVIVGGEGRRWLQEQAFRTLVEKTGRRGYFRVIDLSREGIAAHIEDNRVRLEPYDWAVGEVEIGLWLRVAMADNPPSESSTRIVLEVTAFDHRGEPLLLEKRFEGRCIDVGLAARARIDVAMAKAIEALLASITPIEITRRVFLDDADRDQRFILDVALDGNIARAREEMKSYIDKHPANARAIYNLAVLTEAMGQVQEALVLYDRALALEEEPLYRRTRDAARRFADLEAQTRGASVSSQ